jgi:hypothetical protein
MSLGTFTYNGGEHLGRRAARMFAAIEDSHGDSVFFGFGTLDDGRAAVTVKFDSGKFGFTAVEARLVATAIEAEIPNLTGRDAEAFADLVMGLRTAADKAEAVSPAPTP